ncbi:MAG TPA: heparinase II/III family protein [Stellaceae bacterium]|nr:heparinase II/III family protein [Stellaceae bacterium]
MLSRLRQRVVRAVAGTRLYRHTLFGRIPTDLEINIAQRWPGDPKRGAALLAGEIELAGEVVRNPSPLWASPSAGTEWLGYWHGFGWLTDLVAAGAAGRQRGRELIAAWLAENPASDRLGWRSDVLASRIFAWIAHFDEIAPRDTDQALREAMLTSLSAQLRHLARTANWEVAGAGRLRALKGLVAGLVALGPSETRLRRALKALERELALQILPDGGHRSRSPSQQLSVLRDLIDLRGVLRTANLVVPDALQGAIERMAPMLRFFRHGDRRLALFNGALEEDGVLIDLVLTRSESKGRAPSQAPHTGFNRLVAEKALVIVDTGEPPPPGFDEHAHAGTLSFELSHERERIIVNCGGYRGAKANWRRVARTSAAHSLLVVADTNSTEIREDGTLGRAPGSVTCERAEDGGRQWIVATHDGYRERFGLGYSRQLFLAANGEDLRGEDRLSGLPGARFAVRFHLHPSVQASLVEDGGSALLRLPSGNLWRLRTAGAEISLGESIYLGSGEARKTQQIVLSGAVAPEGASVRWAIRREPRKPAED